jgi:hypothetical protein
MRLFSIALALACGAGCYGDSVSAPDYPRDEPGPEGADVQIDPAVYDHPRTTELGTDQTRGIAKTLEWPGISTEEGATYHDDAVVVDRVLRDDSDNLYGVRVRLKNTTKNTVKIDWVLRFYTRDGGRIASWAGGVGSQERWQGAVLEPFRHVTLHDFAKVSGAEGFRLYIRAGGSNAEGLPDDPSTKEERKRAREGGASK